MTKATKWSNEIKVIEDKKKAYADNKRKIERFETLTQLIDSSLPTEHPDASDIIKHIKVLSDKFTTQDELAFNALEHNKNVGIHNARVDALLEQKLDFTNRQNAVKSDTISKQSQTNSLNILRKLSLPLV